MAVETVKSFAKSVHIPEDIPQDSYMIEVYATYWYGQKYAYASDAFDVTELPVPLLLLRSLFRRINNC